MRHPFGTVEKRYEVLNDVGEKRLVLQELGRDTMYRQRVRMDRPVSGLIYTWKVRPVGKWFEQFHTTDFDDRSILLSRPVVSVSNTISRIIAPEYFCLPISVSLNYRAPHRADPVLITSGFRLLHVDALCLSSL